MSKKIYPVLFFVFSFLQTFSQTDSIFLNKETNSEIEQKIENVAEAVENSSADYSTLLDGLLYYSEHPLNINTANASALSDLGLLTEIQINAIINYIKSNGKLISIYELQSIDELDMQTIQKILPYIKVSSLNENNYLSWKEIKKYGTHQLISRWSRTLEPQQGYAPIDPATYANSPNSRFLGNPDNLYLRYRFNYGNFLSAGFAAEKDAGEVFLNTKKRTGDINSDKILADKLTPGFDFYTAHIFARNVWKFKQIALGDYQISIGQGAVFSNGLAFGKTADILSIKRNAIGIKPYTSVNPSLLLRGAAMAFNIHNFEVMAWGSNKKVDGSVTGIYNPANDSTLTIASEAGLDDIQISSLQLSGYHRTPGELAKKNTITEQVAGTHISYNVQGLVVGSTMAITKYNGQFTPNANPYNKFEFSGKENINYGIDYDYTFKNFVFYGEAGRSKNGGMALVSGVLISLDPKLILTLHYRNFQKNYQALYSNAVSENTSKQNEQGLYSGLNYKPNNFYNVSVYYDRFYFPWLKYQVSAPSMGYDFFSQINYTPTRKINIYARYRERLAQKDFSEDVDEVNYLVDVHRRNYRVEANYPITTDFTLKQRAEWIVYYPEKSKQENGYYLYNDVAYKALNSAWQFTWRYGIFDTQSYNTRVYSYEKEVLYAYSIPALYNQGVRTYLLTRYTIKRGIDIWFRIGTTVYDNTKTISSGTTQINRNHKTDVRLQVRYRF